mmetsp:Transcript_31080/g.82705  ORF Transcript_31080/g.82705 Transcript_31080/m.82705 type:complete len:90 (-) Transcript_31080:578-847(-)
MHQDRSSTTLVNILLGTQSCEWFVEGLDEHRHAGAHQFAGYDAFFAEPSIRSSSVCREVTWKQAKDEVYENEDGPSEGTRKTYGDVLDE